jgi:CubicO group peptidase (beta-lactamase class C family)
VTIDQWRRVDRVMEEAVELAVFPGAALVVAHGNDVLYEGCYGTTGEGGGGLPVTSATIYDLSSLTKSLATAAAVVVLLARGSLTLDTPIGELLPDFVTPADGSTAATGDRSAVTLRHLLAHASGLPAWRPYWRMLQAEEESAGRRLVATEAGRRRIHEMAVREPQARPQGTRSVYSDVGFIVLGAVIEAASGERLDAFVAREVFAPLGPSEAGFVDVADARRDQRPESGRHRAAPCGDCAWRGGTVEGLVQDENAYAMGGVAGHAGLFASIADVQTLVAEWVAAYGGRSRVLDPAQVREFWNAREVAPASTWKLGWDTPTPGASSAGRFVSLRSVGHLGYTGTSVWIDLDRGVHVILLSNRLHPDRENTAIRQLRPRVHDTIFEILG